MDEFSDPRAITSPDSPLTLDDVRASPELLDLGTPKVREGDPAPDFTLTVLDPGGAGSTRAVTLTDYAGVQPVALVFGSYT